MKTGYKICDAMTRKPISVDRDTTILECVKIMEGNSVGSLVIKENNELIGMLTQHDIVTKLVLNSKDPSKVKASEIMSNKVNTILPSEDIYEGIVKMSTLDVRHLPVVTVEGKLCGLLTMKDVLKIQPGLFELVVERFQLKEEESKPIFTLRASEGICEMCGEYSEKLTEFNGSYACNPCRTGKKQLY